MENRILLFLDTEFSDFREMYLISIGIVSSDHHEFYAENAEYSDTFCSDFTKIQVLPRLQGGEHAMPYSKLKHSLQQWLSELLVEHSILRVVFDYQGDWFLLGELLADFPLKKKVEGVKDNLDQGIELYFQDRRELQHHALADAWALRHAFRMKYGKSLPY